MVIFLLVQKQADDELMKNLVSGYRILLPYLLFAAMLWKSVNNRPYRFLILAAWVAPIAWGCFFTLFYLVAYYFMEKIISPWYVYVIMAFWATAVAYLLEIIPFIVLVMFRNDFRTISGS